MLRTQPRFAMTPFLIGLLFATSIVAAGPRSLTVKGEATAEVPPDFVSMTFDLTAREDRVEKAKDDVDRRMARVLAALSTFEIADEDLAFGGVEVEQAFKWDRFDNDVPIGFDVSRSIEVRLRAVEDYESLVQALVAAGIDDLRGVSGGLDDPATLEQAALAAAAENARRKAEVLAATLDVRLGPPIEVGEDRLVVSPRFGQVVADEMMTETVVVRAQERGVPDPLPFVPDVIEIQGTVEVRFEVFLPAADD